jgi:hypothetical protein
LGSLSVNERIIIKWISKETGYGNVTQTRDLLRAHANAVAKYVFHKIGRETSCPAEPNWAPEEGLCSMELVKVKLSLCLTKHHDMKTYWGVEV